jgi:coenzyme F420-reducing hydrogenase alpha subunit
MTHKNERVLSVKELARIALDDAELTRQCEQAIRNYDPCISCSAHFLDLTVERSLFSRTDGGSSSSP